MLDSVLGLPLHPLVVHAVVVLLPLAAVGVIVLALVPRWRRTFAPLVLGALVVAAVSAVVATVSGNALAERVGLPAEHQRYGTLLAISAAVLLVVDGGWLLWTRRAERPDSRRKVLGWISAALSVGVLILTVLTGHSGSVSVWGGFVDGSTAAPVPTASLTADPGPTASPTPEPTEASRPADTEATPAPIAADEGYTLEEVAQHATPESCWIVVDQTVYDVTDWIPQHPGGADRIIPLCGTDATSAFGAQHGDAPQPNQQLGRFELGPLA